MYSDCPILLATLAISCRNELWASTTCFTTVFQGREKKSLKIVRNSIFGNEFTLTKATTHRCEELYTKTQHVMLINYTYFSQYFKFKNFRLSFMFYSLKRE